MSLLLRVLFLPVLAVFLLGTAVLVGFIAAFEWVQK